MFCSKCGKEIEDGMNFCPVCGAPLKAVDASQNPSQSPSQNPNSGAQPDAQNASYDTMCIIGIVVSGLSLLLNFWGLVGIAGVVTSVLGLLNCKQKHKNGKILAIIGIVIGGYSVLYGVIGLVRFM